MLWRWIRTKKPASSGNYVVYLQISYYDIGADSDPKLFLRVLSGSKSKLWYDAMKDGMDYVTSKQS